MLLRLNLSFLLILWCSSVAADVFTVGSGAGCTHASIQDAITAGLANGNGLDVINVARNRTYTAQALLVQNDTVVIQGGFADCLATVPDANQPTVVSGAGGSAAPVLKIQGNGPVTLRHLTIQNGDAAGVADGGGISIIDGPHQIILDNVRLQNNQATRGGGLAVNAGTGQSVSVEWRNSAILSGNQANSDGGGVFCRGASLSLVSSGVQISSNSSGRDGGGVFAEQCSVRLATELSTGVLLNQASRHGGGLHLQGAGALAEIYSLNPNSMTRFNTNIAVGDGGAISTRDGAGLKIQNVLFLNNLAADGGAILMRGTGSSTGNTLEVARNGLISGAAACPPNQDCNVFSGNTASSNGNANENAAAIAWLLDGSSDGQAQVANVRFDANTGGEIIRSSVASDAANRVFTLINALLQGNQTIGTLGALLAGQKLSLQFASLGGNTVSGQALIQALPPLTVLNYVAAEQAGKRLLVQSGGSIATAYLVANDLTGIPPTINNLQAEPGFVSSTDLHLRDDAVALDYASSTGSLSAPYNTDLAGQPRPVDRSEVADWLGVIDVGAYEMPALDLFRDGFESP